MTASHAAAACIAFLWGAFLLLAVAPSGNALDTSYYEASPEVKAMHMDDIALLQKDSSTYVMNLVKRIIGLLIVAVLFFLILMIWSTCLCCCCKNRKQPPEKFLIFLQVFAVLLAAATIACSIVLLTLNSKQSTILVTDFPDSVNFVLTVPTFVTKSIVNASDDAQSMLKDLNLVIDGTPPALKGTFSSVQTVMQAAVTALNQTAESLKNLDTLAAFQNTSLYKDLDTYDQLRSMAYLIIVLVPFFCVLLQYAFVFWNSRFGWFKEKSARNCLVAYVPSWLSVLMLIFILLLFILSAVLLALTTLTADFCYDPYVSIPSIAGMKSNDTAGFYLSCDGTTDVAPPDVQVYFKVIDDGNAVIKSSGLSILTIYRENGCVNNEVPAVCKQAINNFEDTFNNRYLVDVKTLQSYAGCKFIQARVNGLINILCSRVFPTFNLAYGFFVAIGSFVIVAEILHRLASPFPRADD